VAEIRIQRKRRRKAWPWLVGAVALGLLLLLLLPLRANRDETAVPPEQTAGIDTAAPRDTMAQRDTPAPRDTGSRVTTTAAGTLAPAPTAAAAASPPETSAAVRADPTASAFERFIATSTATSNERVNRQYTAEGLRRLADELRKLGASEAGVTSIRIYADSLQMPVVGRNAYSDYTRTAFLATVRELDMLRERRKAAVDIAPLRSNAWAIRPNEALLGQHRSVQAFFESARDALRALSRRE
jgi:hypothetical protein